jgi:hypothetical protein
MYIHNKQRCLAGYFVVNTHRLSTRTLENATVFTCDVTMATSLFKLHYTAKVSNDFNSNMLF